jgi:hypothetical protein
MPLVQMRRFLLGTGAEPSGCQVDNATKVKAEIIIQDEYPVPEEIQSVEINIADTTTGKKIKCFRWNGYCGLRTGVIYTINTPVFTLPVGKYGILTAFIGKPLEVTRGECGISLSEVSC